MKIKVNNMNKEVDFEVRVRDTLLHNEQTQNRRLRSEIVKAKDVLMSQQLTTKAQNLFKNLVDVNNEEKVLLEDGSLKDLLEKEKEHRQTFEYVKNITSELRKKDKET